MADELDPIEELFKSNPAVHVTRLGSLDDLKRIVQEQLDLPDPEPLTWLDEPTDPAQRKDEPWDPGCGRYASDIATYATYAQDLGLVISEYVRREEGTYNPNTNHFLCDMCYIRAGQPTASGRGWKCP